MLDAMQSLKHHVNKLAVYRDRTLKLLGFFVRIWIYLVWKLVQRAGLTESTNEIIVLWISSFVLCISVYTVSTINIYSISNTKSQQITTDTNFGNVNLKHKIKQQSFYHLINY